MSDATIDLLTSTGFVLAVAIGALGVLVLAVREVLSGRPSSSGGVVFTFCGALAVAATNHLSAWLFLGLVALVVGGALSLRSSVARVAIVIPGALAVGSSLSHSPGLAYLPVIVTATIVVTAPLVASFDRRYSATTLATPLVAISFVSVLFVVPDTEVAVVAAGVAAAWMFAGPPAMIASLGRGGAYGVAGLLVWVVASGGAARPASVVAGIATLGLVIAVPVLARLPAGRSVGDGDPRERASFVETVAVLAIQIAVGLLMTVIVRMSGGSVVLVTALAAVVLAIAGTSMTSLVE